MDPEILKDLKELNHSLHSENLSIKNRLLSILKDSNYVKFIKSNYYLNFPIIPNERCGKWYVNPNEYDDTSYFKSTDGHTNNWSFSTRRLNLHLIPIILKNKGIIIIDSTRRGKKIPDSFSKTIPIWIAILNKIILPNSDFKDLLFLPKYTVSEIEKQNILKLLPVFFKNIEKFKDLIIDNLSANIEKKRIFKPFWIFPGCSEMPLFENNDDDDGSDTGDFYPIILLTTSEQFQDGENKMNGYTYVQGAGDDHELWSNGLTPDLFYKMEWDFETLLKMDDDTLNDLIESNLYSKSGNSLGLDDFEIFWDSNDITTLTDFLSIGRIDKDMKFNQILKTNFDKIIVLDSSFDYNLKNKQIYKFNLNSNCKKSGKLLRNELDNIIKNVNLRNSINILILCNTCDDLSIGVALCYLSLFYDSNWNPTDNHPIITKDSIRRHLIKILQLRKVNPQRATLNSVNSFLMS